MTTGSALVTRNQSYGCIFLYIRVFSLFLAFFHSFFSFLATGMPGVLVLGCEGVHPANVVCLAQHQRSVHSYATMYVCKLL